MLLSTQRGLAAQITNRHPNTHIDGAKDNSSRSTADHTMPAADQDSNVVVPMEEHKLLLSHDNEECIKEFKEFAPGEDQSPIGGGPKSHQSISFGA